MKSVRISPNVEFLHTDNHLVAADKPAGLPSQPDASGDTSLVDLVRERIRIMGNKPGNVYVALLHRLDRPTSGIVLLARTDKAAGRMAELFRRRQVDKRYLALVTCHAEPENAARLETHLAPGPKGGMRPAASGERGARNAILDYRLLARSADGTRALLEVHLETGVKHQIRCQLATAGLPVTGDFRYGPGGRPACPQAVRDGRAILLHAHRISFVHPVRREELTVTSPLPGYWRGFMDGMDAAALAALPPGGRP